METEELSTKELLSIHQKQVDEDRNDMKTQLSAEDLAKHQAVEEALSILAKHKIMAFIYADVRDIRMPEGLPCVHQYNTMGCLAEYKEDGSYTDEFGKKLGLFDSAMWHSLFSTITRQGSLAIRYGIDKLDWWDKDDFSKVMDFFNCYVVGCINEYNKMGRELSNEEGTDKTDS